MRAIVVVVGSMHLRQCFGSGKILELLDRQKHLIVEVEKAEVVLSA